MVFMNRETARLPRGAPVSQVPQNFHETALKLPRHSEIAAFRFPPLAGKSKHMSIENTGNSRSENLDGRSLTHVSGGRGMLADSFGQADALAIVQGNAERSRQNGSGLVPDLKFSGLPGSGPSQRIPETM